MTTKKTATESKIDELAAKHGDRALIFAVGETVFAFRAPELEEYEGFQARLRKAAAKDGVMGPINRELCQQTLLEPSQETLNAMFARYPAVPGKISDALAELCGSDIEITVKKG